MGIVEPQREVLRKHVVPEGRFREMAKHGVDNYCCGGGSGFAIMSGHNFEEWRFQVSGRKKIRQVLEAFQDEHGPVDPEVPLRPVLELQGSDPRHHHYYEMPGRRRDPTAAWSS
jgi:hypothetical protein